MSREFKNDVVLENGLTLSALTASRALVLDGSSNLVVSAVTSIELGYLSGVTSAIQTQLDAKLGDLSSTTDNALVRTDGTSGDSLQDSGIIIDDSDNMTGVNDLTVGGDLTVNGTTTTINTATLDVTDANITVNDGGDQLTANTNVAGLTIEMSDATDARIGYDSSTTSKFKAGETGSEAELATISHTQTLTNKTVDGTSASGSNTVTTDADQVTYERVDGSKKNIQAGSDEVEASLTDLDDAIGDVSALGTPTNYSTSSEDEVAARLAGIDTALASSGTDESVKVSANDTTAGYLEAKVVVSDGANATNILEISTLNDGGDEDLQIQIDEAKIDHDALLNFVANEHIDHSGVEVQTAADSGLSGGGDITASRSLVVDINGTTAESSADDADEILIWDDSAGARKKMTRANFLAGIGSASAGDISETSFSGADGQAVAADVTGFAFANGTVRSFSAHGSILVDATADLYEEFDIQGIQKGASWEIAEGRVGDESGVTFTITNAGQIQYTGDTYAGFVSLTIKFRAITTSI